MKQARYTIIYGCFIWSTEFKPGRESCAATFNGFSYSTLPLCCCMPFLWLLMATVWPASSTVPCGACNRMYSVACHQGSEWIILHRGAE